MFGNTFRDLNLNDFANEVKCTEADWICKPLRCHEIYGEGKIARDST